MGNIIQIGNTNLTMSSREIAELCEKNHPHVIRDIRVMLDALKDDPVLDHVVEAKDSRGYTAEICLNKELTMTLVAGYSVVLRNRIIKRWMELEANAANPVAALAAASKSDILRLAADLADQVNAVTAERDHAIATKALIGSKREATAMATASAAATKARKLEAELGRNQRHATIIAVERATGKKLPKNAYVSLRRSCKRNNLSPVEVVDARYGTVKAWPADAWMEAQNINLCEVMA